MLRSFHIFDVIPWIFVEFPKLAVQCLKICRRKLGFLTIIIVILYNTIRFCHLNSMLPRATETHRKMNIDLQSKNYSSELFGRQKPVYRLCANFPKGPEVGIPSARYVNTRARSRYTDGMVYQCQPPEVGIQTLFSNAYWHRNARVIEIQTRQQLKNNFFHETQRIIYEQILHLDT